MPDGNKYSELLISETLIPDIFIVRYMPLLGKDAVNIYLWILMSFKTGRFSAKDAMSYSILPNADINEALSELVKNGLLVRSSAEEFNVIDLRKVEIDEYVATKVDDTGTVPTLKSDEKKRNMLANSIQQTFYAGHMAYAYYKLIDKCLYEYHFEDPVVYALFEEGRETRIHFIVSKMYDLAKTWYDKGYLTSESLKEYYDVRARRDELTKLMGKLLRMHLNDLDITRISKWAEVYKATPDLTKYAFECQEWRGKIRTVDVENKLKEWFDAGITTIDKAMVYEAERHEENKAKASRQRGRNNVRRSGKEAGITLSSADDTKKSGEPVQEFHDDILDMFTEDDDENNI